MRIFVMALLFVQMLILGIGSTAVGYHEYHKLDPVVPKDVILWGLAIIWPIVITFLVLSIKTMRRPTSRQGWTVTRVISTIFSTYCIVMMVWFLVVYFGR